MPTDQDREKRQLGGELIIPVLAVAFTLYFFSSIWNSPWTAKVSAFSVGITLLLVCAIFMIRCLIWISRGEGSFGLGDLVSWNDIHSGRIGLLVTTVGYCILIDWLGFTLTTFLFLSISMVILSRGQNVLFIACISAAMALGGWAVFVWAFDTRFPRGWFENTMKALLANG